MEIVVPDMTAPRAGWHMPEARDVTVMGHRIRYWEKGAGAPLVLMHGFSGSAAFEWGRVIDALAARYRVIVLQCIGFAPSEQPDIVYSTEALCDHLGGFFTALGLKDITLLGESFGGWLVTAYAVRAAQAGSPLPPIARLIVVAGPIGPFVPPKPDAQGFVDPAVIGEVDVWMKGATAYDNDKTRGAIVQASGLARGEPGVAAVGAIAVPVLLVWGDRDELIPLAIGERAEKAIPNAKLVVLAGIGHIPSVECPNEFVRVVGDFAGG